MHTVFVSFDYENDRRYKHLLEAWHAHPRFQFTFEDGTPTEINSDNVGRVKAALTSKVKAATHTLVIVGQYANQPHRHRELIGARNWINFEIRQSIREGKRLAIVMLHPSYALPEELKDAQYSTATSFTESEIVRALDNAPFNYKPYV